MPRHIGLLFGLYPQSHYLLRICSYFGDRRAPRVNSVNRLSPQSPNRPKQHPHLPYLPRTCSYFAGRQSSRARSKIRQSPQSPNPPKQRLLFGLYPHPTTCPAYARLSRTAGLLGLALKID